MPTNLLPRAKRARRRRELRPSQPPPGTPIRLAENRKRKISVPAMRAYDDQGPFMRCLIAFYGEAKIRNGPMVNPEDMPAKLGRADEFWEEWERWKKIAKPKAAASAPEDGRAASAALLSAFKTTGGDR